MLSSDENELILLLQRVMDLTNKKMGQLHKALVISAQSERSRAHLKQPSNHTEACPRHAFSAAAEPSSWAV